VGSYLFFVFLVMLKMPLVVSALLATISLIIIAFIIEKITFRPVRDKNPISALIISVGVGFALRSIIEMIFKGNMRIYTDQVHEGRGLMHGLIRVTDNQIMIIVTSIICMIGLFVFLKKTKTGKAIRAVSDSRQVSEILGININKHILIVFALSAILACVAGILLGYENYLQPTRGVSIGIKAFSAIILGGVGSLPGGLIGGFTIGLAENILPGLGLVSTGYKDSIAFFILIIVMLVKPRGIFGISKSEDTRKE
ncbi:MAG: branched-chain amino acid ABC transporter permease, partial [Candidatus Gracilibacteria bacterium]|nr:branched-chain amino acid ABC transporter permease [Candidatus Gracilibacteria bacterium]